MPDRVQDLTNHRKVAVACKNYTDKEVKKAKDELITFFSRNTVDTDDHTNELAYQITAPSGAKLLQLQAIGGNTVKLSPSVASDSTKAMIKTMPSTVYTFDGSKFYGASEVSANLKDLSYPTMSYFRTNSNSFITTSDTSTNRIRTESVPFKVNNGDEFYINNIPSGIALLGVGAFDSEQQIISDAVIVSGNKITINVSGVEYIFLLFSGSGFDDTTKTLFNKIGIFKTNIYEPYFSGIHNLELSGLKVEGENVVNQQDRATSTWKGITYNCENGKATYKGTAEENTDLFLPSFTLPKGTYSFNIFRSSNFGVGFTYSYSGGTAQYNSFTSDTKTITFTDTVTCQFYMHFNANDNVNYEFYIMAKYGSVAPTSFVEYETPITKSIDLTTIVDSNNNKLFPNGKLMGNENVKDVLGVYNQESAWNETILNGSENWYKNESWSSENNIAMYTTLSGAVYNSLNVIIDKDFTVVAYSTQSTTIDQLRIATNVVYLNFTSGGGKINEFTLEKAKQWLANNPLTIQFERETHLTSNTDLSATLRNIQGYSNGSIIVENTYNMDVESVITYNSIIQETLCPSVTVEGANRFDNANTTLVNSTFNASNQTLFSYGGFGLKVFNLTIGQTYTITSTKVMLLGETNDLTNSGTVSNGTSYTFTATTTYLLVTNYAPNEYEEIFENLMINLGSTALSYRPYKPSITRNLPTQASDGYGVNADVHNLRVFSDYEGNAVNKRYTNVNKGDMGTPTWNYNSTAQQFSTSVINDLKLGNWQVAGNILCKPYTTIAGTNLSSNDMCIALNDSTQNIFAKDSKYTDGATFKLANTNEPLYYELADASKTETDMDNFDYFFDVEEGDVITFNNTYAQQVYATYSFIIKEAKSNE